MFKWKLCRVALAAILAASAVSQAQSPDLELYVDGVQLPGVAVERVEFDGSTLQVELDEGSAGVAAVAIPAPDPEPEPEPEPEPDPVEGPDLDPPQLIQGLARNPHPVGPYHDPSNTRLPRFVYEGGFRLKRGTTHQLNDIASMKGGFSVSGDKVWVTSNRTHNRNDPNRGMAVGSFHRPAPVVTSDVRKMPIAEPAGDFFRIAPFNENGRRMEKGDAHLSGVSYDPVTDKVIVTVNVFYDATKRNTQFISVMDPDGSNIQGWFNVTNRQVAAGQVLKTPSDLIDRVGGRLYMHPEHWTNIISRVCQGPCLHGWDFDGTLPEPGKNIKLTPHLVYKHGQSWGEHQTRGKGGEIPQSNPIFNRLSRYEVSFFWQNSYISLGLNQGQRGGIGYGHPPYPPFHKGNYTYIQNDQDNYFWITDLDDIFEAKNPSDPKPVEWGYLQAHMPGQRRIQGAYADPEDVDGYARVWLLSFGDTFQGGGSQPFITQYRLEER